VFYPSCSIAFDFKGACQEPSGRRRTSYACHCAHGRLPDGRRLSSETRRRAPDAGATVDHADLPTNQPTMIGMCWMVRISTKTIRHEKITTANICQPVMMQFLRFRLPMAFRGGRQHRLRPSCPRCFRVSHGYSTTGRPCRHGRRHPPTRWRRTYNRANRTADPLGLFSPRDQSAAVPRPTPSNSPNLGIIRPSSARIARNSWSLIPGSTFRFFIRPPLSTVATHRYP